MGDEKLRQAVRRSCLSVAAEAEERRHRRARADRHVTTRQLDDGTGRITAIVAAEHLAAVRATLDAAAAKASLRRLFVRPSDRALVAMESASRTFPTALAELLDLRDGGMCRTSWCNARIRHHDHVVRSSDGGPTAADNGQGLCERCNYVKETPGWSFWVATRDFGPHEVYGVTERLRILRSTAPPLPGRMDHALSPGELRPARALTSAA